MAHAHRTQATSWVGWIGIASFLLFFTGILHVVYGFAALFHYSWYVTTASGNAYPFDLTQWGWSLLISGVLLVLTSILLFTGNMIGRIIAGIIVTLSLIANASLMSVTPIWSTIAIVFDIFILYAIIAHGAEMKGVNDEMM